MLIAAAEATKAAGHGIWTDTVGLLFAFVILLPVLMQGLIIVSVISGRGEKAADAELRSRWGVQHASSE